MFFLASTGRCGTVAICQGLDSFSDHQVEHEPEPLLREAWLKHRVWPYWSSRYRRRLREYADRHQRGEQYGESVRTPNLLRSFVRVAPGARVLIVVRNPIDYVRSAFNRDVLQKDDEWDRYRLVPRRSDRDLPVAMRIGHHWQTVNSYLLDLHRSDVPTRVVLHQPLEQVIENWCEWLGVTLVDSAGLFEFLARKPNRAESIREPEGLAEVQQACEPLWSDLQTEARR